MVIEFLTVFALQIRVWFTIIFCFYFVILLCLPCKLGYDPPLCENRGSFVAVFALQIRV